MKCYNHQERDSVAICKACGKAICHECALESKDGFACQQSCINSLSIRNELFAKQAGHLKNLKHLNLLGFFFSIGMGILFTYFSFLDNGIVYTFIFLLGVGFIVYGSVALFVNMLIILKTGRSTKK